MRVCPLSFWCRPEVVHGGTSGLRWVALEVRLSVRPPMCKFSPWEMASGSSGTFLSSFSFAAPEIKERGSCVRLPISSVARFMMHDYFRAIDRAPSAVDRSKFQESSSAYLRVHGSSNGDVIPGGTASTLLIVLVHWVPSGKLDGVACCMLPDACCLLPVACCMLLDACCLLPHARCS